MTKIIFCFNSSEIDDLINEIYLKNLKANIGGILLTPNNFENTLDRHLWHKPQLAFILHSTPNYPQVNNIALIICEENSYKKNLKEFINYTPINSENIKSPQSQKRQYLINLGADPLEHLALFDEVYEIVPVKDLPTYPTFPNINQAITSARNRYRYYNEQGYQIVNDDQSQKVREYATN